MAAATTQGEATASTARAADPRPVRPGQVVAAQVAVALPIAATGHGPLMMAAAVIAGAALIALAWVRMRRRWLFEWAALGVRYRARSHALPAGASAAELLRLVAPDSTVDEAGVVSDRHGLTAILELGDSTLLRDGWTAPSAVDARHAPGADADPRPWLATADPRRAQPPGDTRLPLATAAPDQARPPGDTRPRWRRPTAPSPAVGRPMPTAADGRHALPAPSSLLPPEGPEHPPTRVQLLLAGSPAPAPRIGGGPPATSYRQLSDGRLPGYERAVIAVRVLRAEGWSEADLRRSLTSASRRISRRLAPLRARRLDGDAVLRVLTELAHHDGSAVRESWGHSVVGGLVQASFRLRRWPDLRAETARRLVPRMLALPAAATTVVIGAGPGPSARPDRTTGLRHSGPSRGRRPGTAPAGLRRGRGRQPAGRRAATRHGGDPAARRGHPTARPPPAGHAAGDRCARPPVRRRRPDDRRQPARRARGRAAVPARTDPGGRRRRHDGHPVARFPGNGPRRPHRCADRASAGVGAVRAQRERARRGDRADAARPPDRWPAARPAASAAGGRRRRPGGGRPHARAGLAGDARRPRRPDPGGRRRDRACRPGGAPATATRGGRAGRGGAGARRRRGLAHPHPRRHGRRGQPAHAALGACCRRRRSSVRCSERGLNS